MKPQITSLTGLRGLAAIWVMLFHFIKADGVGGEIDFPHFFWEGRLGVDVFFVLSGFVLSYVYAEQFRTWPGTRPYLRYLAMRLGRIYPLHALTLLALIAGVLLAKFMALPLGHLENFDPAALLPQFLLLHGWTSEYVLSWNFVSWSISAEWFAYLLLLPLLPVIGQHVRLGLLTAGLALAWAAFLLVLGRDPDTLDYLDAYHYALPRAGIEFCAGYAAFRIWRRVQISPRHAELIVLAAGLSLIWIASNQGPQRLLLAPVLMYLIIGLASSKSVSGKVLGSTPLRYLGDISYSVYMLHPLILLASNMIVGHLLPADLTLPWLILMTDTALTLIAASLTYHYFEHPCRRLVKNTLAARRYAAET